MPLYDFRCRVCGRVFEAMAPMDGSDGVCGCGGAATRLVSAGRAYRADADWIASVTDVVDKASPSPHVRAFLADPSRANYRRFLRGEKIRPMEEGEFRLPAARNDAVRREVRERFIARNGL
ncbi:zinc ribbon domain-containing protein [Solidesulfovibrio sp. C21]|uniref:zinc ribbon domain-containing protein n=1 Tax=Solidesulfovibrio sp. C21 TaxID=3398613 RepID=UPI0039FB9C24